MAAFYETFRRATGVLPGLSRLGLGRLMSGTGYGGLPPKARDAARAFNATPRGARSVRDEFSELRTAMAQAKKLTTLGDRPLVVMTATKDAQGGWMSAQNQLATLSTTAPPCSAKRVARNGHRRRSDCGSLQSRNRRSRARGADRDSSHDEGGRTMKRIWTKGFVAGIGIALVVSAYTTTATSASPAAVSASLRPTKQRQHPSRQCCPSRPVASRSASRPSPAVSPDATTRVWYPARRGTGTGTPVYLAPQVSPRTDCRPRCWTERSHERRSTPSRARSEAATSSRAHARMGTTRWRSPPSLAQELASHGYVVVAVDPTFGSEDQMSLPADTANPGRRLEQVSSAIDFAAGTDIERRRRPGRRTEDRGRRSLDRRSRGLPGEPPRPARARRVRPRRVAPRSSVGNAGQRPRAHDQRVRIGPAELSPSSTHHDRSHREARRRDPRRRDRPPVPGRRPSRWRQDTLGLGAIGCAGTTTTNTVILRFLDAVLVDGEEAPSAASLTRAYAAPRAHDRNTARSTKFIVSHSFDNQEEP